MSGDVIPFTASQAGEIMEQVLIRGDLARLEPEDRARYYVRVCQSVGLNPLTRPFEYISLNGKLTLYALKGCTDQLRALHGVSVTNLVEVERDGLHIVTVYVQDQFGRLDAAKGVVALTYPETIRDRHGNLIKHPKAGQPLTGEDLANAVMKAETKAKRRATLSLCGLGMLDETEVADIPAECKRMPEVAHAEPKKLPPPRQRREPRTVVPSPKRIWEAELAAERTKPRLVYDDRNPPPRDEWPEGR